MTRGMKSGWTVPLTVTCEPAGDDGEEVTAGCVGRGLEGSADETEVIGAAATQKIRAAQVAAGTSRSAAEAAVVVLPAPLVIRSRWTTCIDAGGHTALLVPFQVRMVEPLSCERGANGFRSSMMGDGAAPVPTDPMPHSTIAMPDSPSMKSVQLSVRAASTLWHGTDCSSPLLKTSPPYRKCERRRQQGNAQWGSTEWEACSRTRLMGWGSTVGRVLSTTSVAVALLVRPA